MNRVGVPAAPINDYDQVFNDVHLHQRNFFWSSQHPRLGDVTQLGNPMRFSRSHLTEGAAGPSLVADSDRVLSVLYEIDSMSSQTSYVSVGSGTYVQTYSVTTSSCL